MESSTPPQPDSQHRQDRPLLSQFGLVLSGLLLVASFVNMLTLIHYTQDGWHFVTLIGVAFAAYCAAIFLLRRVRVPFWFILAIAICCRVPLWFDDPTLSSDVWRYLWDGRQIEAGVNPYANRVDDPMLADLRTPPYDRIDHTWMATPYPPASQVTFAAVTVIAPQSATAMQITFTLFDLTVIGCIALLLRHLGRPVQLSLLYAWNPLIIVEFAHGAHVDSLMTLFVLLAIMASLRGWQYGSALAMAGAVLTKFIPVILLPILLRRWGPRPTALFGAVTLLAFLPFISAGLGMDDSGTGLFGAARIYANEWKTNDGVFFVLVHLLDSVVPDPIQVSRLLGYGILGSLGLVILWHTPANASPQRLFTGAALLISTYILFSAAVFPWYLAWLLAILPLLPLQPYSAWTLFTIAWIYFSAAVNLSYLFYVDPANPGEIEWIRAAEYVPLVTLLIIAAGVALIQGGLARERSLLLREQPPT